MRPAAAAFAATLLLALTACSAEPPSGATPLPTPAPTPTPTIYGVPLPFAGEYVLSLSIDSACARDFPAGLRVRRFPVRIVRQPDHSTLGLEIDNYSTPGWPAPLWPGTAYLDDDGVVHFHFAFTETLSEAPVPGQPNFVRAETFQMDGSTTLALTGVSLEGNYSGAFVYWRDTAVPPPVECRSDRHDFHLRPR
jgi:hypothetical protein